MDAMNDTKQRFTVDHPRDLHRRFKLHCVANGLNMSMVIKELVEGYLRAKSEKKLKK